MVYHRILSDSKFPQVPRTLLSILTDLNNAVVRIVSIRPPISNSSSPLFKPLVTDPRTPIINGITVTLMFYSFLSSLARFKNLSLFSLPMIFTLWSTRTVKSKIRQVLFFSFIFLLFFFVMTRFGLLTGIRGFVWISESERILRASLCGTDSGLCINHWVI